MSQETMEWLNRNVLIGYTDERGHAWHYRASDQGDEPNHYSGAIPVEDVQRRLFGWEAVTLPVYVKQGDKFVALDDYQAIANSEDGKVFQIAGADYQIHSYNEWLLKQVALILDDDLQIGAAGLLNDGGRAWVSVEMPKTIKTPEGIDFRPFLLAATSHNSTLATTYKRANQLSVCDNTLAIALGEKGQEFRVRHTKNSNARLGEARKALEILHQDADAFTAIVSEWCATPVSDKQYEKVLDQIVPLDDVDKDSKGFVRRMNQRIDITTIYDHDMRAAPWRGTKMGVVQALNTWSQHSSTIRGANARAERNQDNFLRGKTEEFDAKVLGAVDLALA